MDRATPAMRHARLLVLAFPFVILLGAAPAKPKPEARDEVSRGCPPERAQNGEVRLVFLGDSGYGTGVAEWGAHRQDAIAARINRLALEPDLVFFLGDNIYWTGSSELYKDRFDVMYDPLIRGCKAHVALGNHDVKGCRAVEEFERWESCLQDLRSALVADRKARYMRQGMTDAAAEARAEDDTAAETAGELASKAIAARKANCLPGDATAYQDADPGRKGCNAAAALAHAQFGFGSIENGDPVSSQRARYYSVLWPLPKLSPAGGLKSSTEAVTRPLVDVIVLDSNTLKGDGDLLRQAQGPAREDRLQLLWLRNAMAQWLPAPGEDHRIWKILAMHHPAYTPRGCVCRLFGKCWGGHSEAPGLQQQFREALEGLEPPDFVVAAHNHIYARSHPLDASGAPTSSGTGGTRHFVSGGGGAPLYAILGKDSRFAKAIAVNHFIYMRLTAASAFFWVIDSDGQTRDAGCFDKGSNVDHPLGPDFSYHDALPQRCGAEGK